MKTFLINIGMLLGLIALYYSGVLSLLASEYALWCSLLLVAVMLLIGLKVFGNPLRQGKRK